MPKHHRPDEPKRPQPPPIDFLWIKNQFEQLHHEHALILDRINELGGSHLNLTPELSAALIETAKKVKAVDEKVPDKTVPPGWTPAPSKNFPQTKPPTSNERTFQ